MYSPTSKEWLANLNLIFSMPNTFFYAYNVCRDKTLRQCSYHLFSLLSYDYFIQIYYENKFTFLVYFLWKVCEMTSKGNYMLHFFLFLKHFVGSIQLAYFERCLVFLCIRPLEKFNFPIVVFPGRSLFSSQPNKTTYLWI